MNTSLSSSSGNILRKKAKGKKISFKRTKFILVMIFYMILIVNLSCYTLTPAKFIPVFSYSVIFIMSVLMVAGLMLTGKASHLAGVVVTEQIYKNHIKTYKPSRTKGLVATQLPVETFNLSYHAGNARSYHQNSVRVVSCDNSNEGDPDSAGDPPQPPSSFSLNIRSTLYRFYQQHISPFIKNTIIRTTHTLACGHLLIIGGD